MDSVQPTPIKTSQSSFVGVEATLNLSKQDADGVATVASPRPGKLSRQASYRIEVAELQPNNVIYKDPSNDLASPKQNSTDGFGRPPSEKPHNALLEEETVNTAIEVSLKPTSKAPIAKDARSPQVQARHASYVIDNSTTGLNDSMIDKDEVDRKPTSTPLIPRELTMITRELSLIARQGTTITMGGRENTNMSSYPQRTRESLVSRLSILPPAFVVPMLELQFDSVSGVSMPLLSFIYQHAPSILCIVEEAGFLPMDIDDDELRIEIEELLSQKQLMYPLSSIPGSENKDSGVKVQVVPIMTGDFKGPAKLPNLKTRKTSVHSWSNRSSGKSQKASNKGDDNDNSLPMVTPRGILLTPEPHTPVHSLYERSHGNLNQSGTDQTTGKKLKTQLLVCIKTRRDSKNDKAIKEQGDGYCPLITSFIRDIYSTSYDWQGLDFFTQNDLFNQGQVVLDLNENEEVYVVMETSVWPEQTQDWFNRQRINWPSLDIVNEIREASCHVSAYPSKPDQPNTFIKQKFFTFPEVDGILFSSLSSTQRTVYMLVSVLYKKHFSDPALLKLFHIKALFFQVCENTPPDFWKETELATCVFHVLSQLIDAVAITNIPHFITNENLLHGAPAERVKEVADMIRLVRKTPIESLVNSSIFGPSDEELFEPILNYIMRDRRFHTTRESLSCIIQAAINIGKTYVPDGRKEQAVRVLDDACAKIFQYRHFTEEAIALVRVTCDLYCDLCDLDKVIEYTENMAYIAYEYDCQYLDLSICLSRIASLYHCKARQCESNRNKQRNKMKNALNENVDDLTQEMWILKTTEYFELALMEDFSLVSVLHCAIYLMKQNNVREAIVKLTNALALTDESDEAELFADSTTFTLMEVDILDDDLALEVKVMGKIVAPTIAMAYYQLCRALLAAGIERGLEEYLFILEVLATCDDNTLPHTTWALLGYIKRYNKDMAGARRAFQKALNIHKGYYLLRDHLDMFNHRKTSKCCEIL